MKLFVVSSNRFLFTLVLVFCFASVLAGTSDASGQKQKGDKVVRTEGSSITVASGQYTLIPEATEPCAPQECEWWKQVREAGNNLYKRSDESSKRKFYLLLLEGQQKAYRIPLKDRPIHTLVPGRVTYPESARRRGIQGTVLLSVEYGADASVRDVQIKEGLGRELDEIAIQAVRQCVFLPAIKDGAFVNSRYDQKFGFVLGGPSWLK